jgi:hypothetical protein
VTDAMTLPDRRPIAGTHETALGHEARTAINARRRTQTPTAGPRKTAIGFLRRSTPKRAIEARPAGASDPVGETEPGADGPPNGGRKAG